MTADLRLAQEGDLPRIMAIVGQAQAFLAANGVNQWQDGYPDETVMRGDIGAKNAYVLEVDGKICAIAAILFEDEPTYAAIYEGTWSTPEPYACIHRMAVDASCRGQGIADQMLRKVEESVRARGVESIRVDTHRDNHAMQRVLMRNGYKQCGVIYLARSKDKNTERLALEKLLV